MEPKPKSIQNIRFTFNPSKATIKTDFTYWTWWLLRYTQKLFRIFEREKKEEKSNKH